MTGWIRSSVTYATFITRSRLRLSSSTRYFNSTSLCTPRIAQPGCYRRSLHTPQDGARQFRSNKGQDADAEDTVFALSSGPGRAAIAVIRISGSQCRPIYRHLCPGKPDPDPRRATVRTLYEPLSGSTKSAVLDTAALILFFPGPKSVTGEDILELHVHGGPAIVRAVLGAIPKCTSGEYATGDLSRRRSSIRYAEPGEFTKRSFYNRRLSLPQIEALGDTLAANTEQQRILALRGSDARTTAMYAAWRNQLLQARGQTEAYLDFSEDQHLEGSQNDFILAISSYIKEINSQLCAHLQKAARGELLRNGIKVALLGPPNAGKSSLLNRIIGREAAIVSEEAGTTRDIVEVSVDINGYLVLLGDTAGLRSEACSGVSQPQIGSVEMEGIRRATKRALESEVVVVLLAIPGNLPVEDGTFSQSPEREVLDVAAKCSAAGKEVILVLNKSDLLSANYRSTTGRDEQADHPFVRRVWTTWQERLPHQHTDPILISCTASPDNDTGGIQEFMDQLVSRFRKLTDPEAALDKPGMQNSFGEAGVWEDSIGTTYRQTLLLEECQSHLDTYLSAVEPTQKRTEDLHMDDAVDLVIAAESLRAAAECLARVTGQGMAGDVEEVLGVVFEKFCVGK